MCIYLVTLAPWRTNNSVCIKNLLFGDSNMFEALGFQYFGPVDGHNVERLVQVLEKVRSLGIGSAIEFKVYTIVHDSK